MSEEPICPCEEIVHPRVLHNPPGLDTIDYRVGDYSDFRAALLRVLPGEQALAGWHPSPTGDLALQLVEWWAYLSDILTFYNERIANGAYLRTAYLPGGAARLVSLLGYRPRPGIGATGVLGAVVSARKPITLPAGFGIQSKPGPGQQPQVFELDEATPADPAGAVPADARVDTILAGATSVLLRGTVTSLRPEDLVVLVRRGPAAQAIVGYTTATVAGAAKEKDPRGRTNTRITFTAPLALPAGSKATDYRVLRSDQETHLYPFTASPAAVIGGGFAHLAALLRGIAAGDLVLFQAASLAVLGHVTQYDEDIWYANTATPGTPNLPPTELGAIAIPVIHTRLSLTASSLAVFQASISAARVRFALRDAGEILDTPPTRVTGASLTLVPAGTAPFPAESGVDVLIEDGIGEGLVGRVTNATPSQIQVVFPEGAQVDLAAPLRVLYDLLAVSRGKTVAREILGSGDASLAAQVFTLKKSPLTYLQGGAPGSTETYRSTLRVLVDGIAWTEVPSFYGQAPNARVFVTREDAENKTHVLFGDGINGARLPTGASNVVGSYRFGSGREAPAAGTLAIVLKPYPGLQAVKNPLRVGGGDDPDPPSQIKRYAPRSTLTFGRAVAGDDFETIAAQAPSVVRARSYFTWDGVQQRATVIVYVGDDAAAVVAARAALDRAVDPNRFIRVLPASSRACKLSMTLLVDPRREADDVKAGVTRALLDPEKGLFSPKVIRVGEALYDSRIYDACLAVPGAVAVHDFSLVTQGLDTGERHSPGEGGFFVLDAGALVVTTEVAIHVE